MPSTLRRIAVCLNDAPGSDGLIRQAAALARGLGAVLVGLWSLRRPFPSPPETFARGPGAAHAVHERQSAREQALLMAARGKFGASVRPQDVQTEFRPVWDDDVDPMSRAFRCDLIITGHPRLPGSPDAFGADRLLQDATRPVLLLPRDWTGPLGRRVLIAWNGSPAALQAVDQALPLFAPGATLTLLVVDEAASAASIAELVGRLHFHGHEANVMRSPSLETGVADTLNTTAVAMSADLVVLGGYSRSASMERWFGGVTRSLLAGPPAPLLLSHPPKVARRAPVAGEPQVGEGLRPAYR